MKWNFDYAKADEGPYSQSYGFSSSRVWMWVLDHKEDWVLKNSWLLNCGAREDSWESLGQQGVQTSQSQRKSTLDIHWEDWWSSWSPGTLASWCEELTHWKRPNAEKDWRQEEKGPTEDKMVGWQLWLNGREFEQALGDDEGQGNLVCCSPWGLKELDSIERQNEQKRLTFNTANDTALIWENEPSPEWCSLGKVISQDFRKLEYLFRMKAFRFSLHGILPDSVPLLPCWWLSTHPVRQT